MTAGCRARRRVEITFGAVQVFLAADRKQEHPLTLLVIRGFGDRPFMALSNYPCETAADVEFLALSYGKRWAVEESYRWQKSDDFGLDLEAFLIRGYDAIRRLVFLALLAHGFLCETMKHASTVNVLRKAEKFCRKSRELTKFLLYQLIEGVRKALAKLWAPRSYHQRGVWWYVPPLPVRRGRRPILTAEGIPSTLEGRRRLMGFFDALTAPLGAQFLYPLDTYGRPMSGRLDVGAGYGLSREVVKAVGADAAIAAARRIANGSGKPVAVPMIGQNKAVLIKPRRNMPGFAARRPFVLPAQVRGPLSEDLRMSFARGPLTDEQLMDIKARERFVAREVAGEETDAPYKANTGEPVKRIETFGPSTPNNAAREATLNVVRKAAGEGRALTSGAVSDAYKLFHFCFQFNT